MRYYLFVSHGTLAPGMTEALRMLAGQRDNVLQTAFKDGMPLPTFQEEIKQVLAPVQAEDEVLVLADLVNGSPLTTTMAALAEKIGLDHVRAVGGMNLPMAIAALEGEDDPIDETVAAMIAGAVDEIKAFNANADGEDEI